jgi:hypothetical protein
MLLVCFLANQLMAAAPHLACKQWRSVDDLYPFVGESVLDPQPLADTADGDGYVHQSEGQQQVYQ